ncbi:MAG: tail fiber domain-containing protein, partial [bacterium]|nr:tail fiber domain-containing protein [bacterium]
GGSNWTLGDGFLRTSTTTDGVLASYFNATSTTATSTFAGGLSVAGTSGLTVLQNGNVGIGLIAPLLKLDVAGGGRFTGAATSELTGDINPGDATLTVPGSSTLFTTELVVGDRINVSGEIRTVVAIASDTSLTIDTTFSTSLATDTTPEKQPAVFIARDSNNAVQMVVNDAGLTTINTLETGALNFDTDAGAVSWVDLPISSTTAGTIESYTAQIASSPVLTVYGESNGPGLIRNLRLGLGTTTPLSRFTIAQSTDTATGSITMFSTTGSSTSIYVTATGTLAFDINGLTPSLSIAGAWTNSSDIAYKKDIVDLGTKYGLADLMKTNPRFYKMKNSDIPQIGFIAQELEKVVPEVVTGEEGSKGITYGNLVALSFQSIKELNIKFNNLISGTTSSTASFASVYTGTLTSTSTIDDTSSDVSISTSSLTINSLGDISIGTTSTSTNYKLYVGGDIAGTAFVNITTLDVKKDILYISESEDSFFSRDIEDMKIVRYHNSDDLDTDPFHLGLEEAPAEVMSEDGKGIDIYKLTIFALDGVQKQVKKFDSLEKRLNNLELMLTESSTYSVDFSTSTLTSITASSTINVISGWMLSLGARIEEGVMSVLSIITDSVKTKSLTIEPDPSQMTASGITIFDRSTEEPVCIYVSNGVMHTEPGRCGGEIVKTPIVMSTTSTTTSITTIVSATSTDVSSISSSTTTDVVISVSSSTPPISEETTTTKDVEVNTDSTTPVDVVPDIVIEAVEPVIESEEIPIISPESTEPEPVPVDTTASVTSE